MNLWQIKVLEAGHALSVLSRETERAKKMWECGRILFSSTSCRNKEKTVVLVGCFDFFLFQDPWLYWNMEGVWGTRQNVGLFSQGVRSSPVMGQFRGKEPSVSEPWLSSRIGGVWCSGAVISFSSGVTSGVGRVRPFPASMDVRILIWGAWMFCGKGRMKPADRITSSDLLLLAWGDTQTVWVDLIKLKREAGASEWEDMAWEELTDQLALKVGGTREAASRSPPRTPKKNKQRALLMTCFSPMTPISAFWQIWLTLRHKGGVRFLHQH